MDLRTWGHLTSCLPMQVVITFHRMAPRSHSLSVQLWQASAFSDTTPLPCSGLALLPALPGRWRQFMGAPDTLFQSSSLSSMLPPNYTAHLFSSSFNFPTFTASHPQWTFSARGGPIWRKECVSSIHVSQVQLSCGNIYKVWSLRSPNTYSYKQNCSFRWVAIRFSMYPHYVVQLQSFCEPKVYPLVLFMLNISAHVLRENSSKLPLLCMTTTGPRLWRIIPYLTLLQNY